MKQVFRAIVTAGFLCAALFAGQRSASQDIAEAIVHATRSLPGIARPEGRPFQVLSVDQLVDFYGDINDPQLVVFFAGNQFMVVPELIEAFRKKHPEYQRIFVETIPPGVLADQVRHEALVLGNMRITAMPDVFADGRNSMIELQRQHGWFKTTHDYTSNHLSLIVSKGNPKRVASLRDLAREEVRVVMPNPAFEGIGRQIETCYRKAGGEELRVQIMETKVQNGGTFLTQIHHRQSAARILAGESDAGPVWSTEAAYQTMLGNAIDSITIPENENTWVTYTAGVMKTAPHPKAAANFAAFLISKEGQAIYQKYGFSPAR